MGGWRNLAFSGMIHQVRMIYNAAAGQATSCCVGVISRLHLPHTHTRLFLFFAFCNRPS